MICVLEEFLVEKGIFGAQLCTLQLYLCVIGHPKIFDALNLEANPPLLNPTSLHRHNYIKRPQITTDIYYLQYKSHVTRHVPYYSHMLWRAYIKCSNCDHTRFACAIRCPIERLLTFFHHQRQMPTGDSPKFLTPDLFFVSRYRSFE